MHRLPYAFSDAIDCPEFHFPVFWIPAIPAGMTAFCALLKQLASRFIIANT